LDVSEREIRAICQLSRELLLSQPMMLELSAPLKIVGDIHGQFSVSRVFSGYKVITTESPPPSLLCGNFPTANIQITFTYISENGFEKNWPISTGNGP
jgi:hypothetical protein